MNKRSKINLVIGFILVCFTLTGFSQVPTSYKLTLQQAVEMGLQNHQRLKVSQAQLNASEEQVKVSKQQQLPSVTFSANAFYLGDALVLDKDWSKVQTVDMPHFGNTFSLQASQLLYKGGVIKKSIELAELQQQLATLNLVSNEQEIKFLIISNYLDIQKLMNQIQILEQNKVLAQQLLDNITKLHEQDMVTRNELIRSELQVKRLDQPILTMKNNYAILSNQLTYALGLPKDVLIMPTEINRDTTRIVLSETYYSDMARQQHPALLTAEKNVAISQKNIDIQQSNWFPAFSAFGGYNMQRPITSTSPVVDMYSNSWQVGLSLSYTFDNLYKNKRQINLRKSQMRIAQESLTDTQQSVEIAINSAYLKYREAEKQIRLMNESMQLANENYEIVRHKYLNQLVILAEMTDASNAKLSAELEYTNALINATFQYYCLLKSTGKL